MRCMLKVWVAMALLVGVSASAQEQHFYRISSGTTTVITAISPDGWLTWSNAAVGGTCTVEHATSLVGSNVWQSYVQHVTTGAVMRLRCVDLSPPSGMVLIPGGTNAGTDPDFGAYSLTNASAFYMDQCEVTKALWGEVRNDPQTVARGYSDLAVGGGKAANHPVNTVDWYDVIKWCNARSEKASREPVYYTDGGFTQVYKTGQVVEPYVKASANGYRLPTDVQWEYAARGGVASRRFPWGDTDTIQHARANYWSSSSYSYDTSPTRGHHPDYPDYPHTSPVGTFESGKNGYGLYDMAGNVWEWCYNWYPGSEGSIRVARGGSWAPGVIYCRVGYPGTYEPDRADPDVGIRAVLPPGQ
jgi:sulfatase modifying factor 1